MNIWNNFWCSVNFEKIVLRECFNSDRGRGIEFPEILDKDFQWTKRIITRDDYFRRSLIEDTLRYLKFTWPGPMQKASTGMGSV